MYVVHLAFLVPIFLCECPTDHHEIIIIKRILSIFNILIIIHNINKRIESTDYTISLLVISLQVVLRYIYYTATFCQIGYGFLLWHLE